MTRWLKWFWHLVFPPRASTQTWMFLTFALFVGMAVICVGMYVAFILRVQIRQSTEQTLLQQAERIAILLEETETGVEKEDVVKEISRLTDLHIRVVTQDGQVWDWDDPRFPSNDSALVIVEKQAQQSGTPQFLQRKGPAGQRQVFVLLHRPATGLTLRLGQAEPLLFALVRNMQLTLVLGMVMALLMALVGSWIASGKVTKPMQGIRNSARQIFEGKLDEHIRVDTRSAEVQDLAKSLNQMADSYREKIDDLERMAHLQSEFIGNVSHEVRNPIFAISGYLEALGSPKLGDDMRKRYAEKGLLNLERLQNLFNDLIEIARLEYREDLIKRSIFDLQELLDEVTEMLRPKAERKAISLVTDNPPFMVEADRNRIRQVLINLIDNAIAYSDEGTIRCRFSRRLDKVRVEVVDNGRGIGDEHLERIFERFYRIDPDRSRKSGGTGLGLSIVKQILQAHGESIHVESTLGRGTRFWFELLYTKQPAETAVSI